MKKTKWTKPTNIGNIFIAITNLISANYLWLCDRIVRYYTIWVRKIQVEFIWIQMIINWFPLLHEVTYMIENSFWLNYFIIKSSSWFISLIKETLYSVHDFCFLILKMCPENFREHLRYKNVYFFIIIQVFSNEI